MQIPGTHPGPSESILGSKAGFCILHQSSRWSLCRLKFENHWVHAVKLGRGIRQGEKYWLGQVRLNPWHHIIQCRELGISSIICCTFPFNSHMLHRASIELHDKFDIIQQCFPNSFWKQKARMKRQHFTATFQRRIKVYLTTSLLYSYFDFFFNLQYKVKRWLCVRIGLKAYYRAAPEDRNGPHREGNWSFLRVYQQ